MSIVPAVSSRAQPAAGEPVKGRYYSVNQAFKRIDPHRASG